jgi:hypothetical protein
MKYLLLNKLYSPESIVDIERDVYESLEDLDVDEHGFIKGDVKGDIEVTVNFIHSDPVHSDDHTKWKSGQIVKYIGSNQMQVDWGHNDDPEKYLNVGDTYEIEKIEVHTWHTKVYLKNYPDKKFNSASFKLCLIS